MSLVQTQDLTKVYGAGDTAVTALDHVSVAVNPGEFVAVMGPSGCGKSTLLHLIGGLDRPTSGSVKIENTSLETLNDDKLTELRRRKIGFVFQFFNLIPVLDATENAALPLTLDGANSNKAKDKAREWLTRVGLEKRLTNRPDQLSGGQQQRVAIVRALAMEPKLLLLDEITSALDPELVSEVLNIVRDLARQGMTMLLATHEMGFAREVASKVCFLYGGVVHEEGPPEQIFGDPKDERTRAFLKRIIEAGRL